MGKLPKKVFVKNIPNGLIRDPITLRHLKPEGEWKEADRFWLRKIHLNEVIECEPPKEERPEPVEKEPAKPVVKKDRKGFKKGDN